MQTYPGIDTHGHGNIWNLPAYWKKSAMQIMAEDAQEAGIGRIFLMPNIVNPITKRPVVRKADVIARLKFVRQLGLLQYYRTYVGATLDYLEEAADVVLNDDYPGSFTSGIKAYFGPTVGPLAIVEESGQKDVFKRLSDKDYERVLAMHCEDKSKFKLELWDEKHPETHCLARPLEAELSSYKKQTEFARETDFEGILYFCHATSSKCIELAKDAKRDYGLNVAVEISPIHAILSMDDSSALGMFGKVNPPLRSREEQKGLLYSAKHETEIPIVIGSEHSQHDFFEKIRYPHKSGMGRDVYKFLYPELIKEISSDPSVPNNRVEDLTRNNPVKIFGKRKCGVA